MKKQKYWAVCLGLLVAASSVNASSAHRAPQNRLPLNPLLVAQMDACVHAYQPGSRPLSPSEIPPSWPSTAQEPAIAKVWHDLSCVEGVLMTQIGQGHQDLVVYWPAYMAHYHLDAASLSKNHPKWITHLPKRPARGPMMGTAFQE